MQDERHGTLDVCSMLRVAGRVTTAGEPPSLQIFVNETCVGTISDLDADPSQPATEGAPRHFRFSWWFQPFLCGGERVSLCFEDGAALNGSPAVATPVDGHLDVCTTDQVSGWAIENGAPAELELFASDALWLRLRCDRPRPGFAAHGVSDRCGFDIQLPRPLLPDEPVSVRFASGAELPGSPRRAAVPAAQPLPPHRAAARPLRVLVRRRTSLGDVIMTTPVLARLRYQLGAAASIGVETDFPAVFAGNPHVDRIVAASDAGDYDRLVDLDLAYERHPNLHVIDAYMQQAFLDMAWPAKQCQLHRAPLRSEPAICWSRAVALHPARTWTNRTFSQTFWRNVVDLLRASGMVPVILGSAADYAWPEIEGVHNLSDQLSLHEIATVIERCRCFVGNDSGLLHVAGTTATPIVGLFTVALPERRMPWRAGVLGWRVTPLLPALDCVGCLADAPPPVESIECRRGDYACVGSAAVSPAAVQAAVLAWMREEIGG